MITNTITHGDCIEVMERMFANSVDFVLTDPPYLCNYRPYKNNSGQTIANDVEDGWLVPAFREVYRVLKPDSLCVSFYGWNKTDAFIQAWRAAGFEIVDHLVFRKPYASSSRFAERRHEQAYILAKGRPRKPETPLPEMAWDYTGNKLHPTQKPVKPLMRIIETLTRPGALVLDPFAGSGSTLIAAHKTGRRYLGIELDETYHRAACDRMLRLRLTEAA